MLSNRPLLAVRADAQWFAETAAARSFTESISAGRNTLLVGDAGSGKTTVLHMAELDLREDRRAVAFVSLASVDDVAQATVALARAAAERGWIEDPDQGLVDQALRRHDPFAPNSVLRLLAAVPEGATFLVDDVTGSVGHAVFGRLRDELWQLEGITWGVAATSDEASRLIVPPADAFFERRVVVEPLGELERRDLLKRRAKRADRLPPEQVEQLVENGPGNPRRLLTLARDTLDDASQGQDLVIGVEGRRQRAVEVGGRPAAMLTSELETLGPVSASDPRLLERLGWTRPRAAGLLGELEEAGVVTSHFERRAGPGRPRKLYELRPPSEFLNR